MKSEISYKTAVSGYKHIIFFAVAEYLMQAPTFNIELPQQFLWKSP